MTIAHDATAMLVEAARIRALAKQGFDEQFEAGKGISTEANLYTKIGELSDEIATKCNSINLCLELIEEVK